MKTKNYATERSFIKLSMIEKGQCIGEYTISYTDIEPINMKTNLLTFKLDEMFVIRGESAKLLKMKLSK